MRSLAVALVATAAVLFGLVGSSARGSAITESPIVAPAGAAFEPVRWDLRPDWYCDGGCVDF